MAGIYLLSFSAHSFARARSGREITKRKLVYMDVYIDINYLYRRGLLELFKDLRDRAGIDALPKVEVLTRAMRLASSILLHARYTRLVQRPLLDALRAALLLELGADINRFIVVVIHSVSRSEMYQHQLLWEMRFGM